MSKKWQEECGVFGILDTKKTNPDISKLTYYGIFSLQHRGQASAGIVVNHDGQFLCHKAHGLVADVFDDLHLGTLTGHAANRMRAATMSFSRCRSSPTADRSRSPSTARS